MAVISSFATDSVKTRHIDFIESTFKFNLNSSIERAPTISPPPPISICLPSLNTRRFLEDRRSSIQSQTFRDWELIIVDDGSTDGSWDFFEQWQRDDDRVKLFNGPQKGLYPGWNDAIRRATGEYVYIATSDDTMAPDCLDKMVGALKQYPKCDLAHCSLRVIGEDGGEAKCDWYPDGPFVKSSQELLDCRHVRHAPFDGLLHLTGASVYASITQLLIRRSVFDRVGMFESTWGPMSDFNWNMRASLLCSTIHVPDTWGGWRLHPNQATAQTTNTDFYETVQQMIDHAIAETAPSLPSSIRKPLQETWNGYFNERRFWWLSEKHSKRDRLWKLLRRLAAGSPVARDYVAWRLGFSEDFALEPVDLLKKWYRQQGFHEPLQRVT
ncbi:Glycosyl transferase family 2 [Neorhodopirellula lusitana]|uniref:Glycosyl transferase family 2 n=1 Tax=Neorhodopirellula lusitana TaxID=445327 RepID=A0ABY1Q109_9BACT|nr:Glycosyl transferase family 2 [Neorhodopirellula lusitana]